MKLTAIGSDYFRAYVDGVEISRHTDEREATEAVFNAKRSQPAARVHYRYPDAEVLVELEADDLRPTSVDAVTPVVATLPVVLDPPGETDQPAETDQPTETELPAETELRNITALRDAGWDVPDPALWWIDHPPPEAIKGALIPPARNDHRGICIKRLWIPRKFTNDPLNYDRQQMAAISRTANSMHRQAITAHHQYDTASRLAGDAAMAEAKAAFGAQLEASIAAGTPFRSFLYGSFGARDAFTAVLALDWINWDTADEFEAAFNKVKYLIEKAIARSDTDRNFRHTEARGRGTGYWNASPHTMEYAAEPLLALCVYGVNPNGESHAWAASIIDHMGLDPDSDPTAVYSQFELANALNLISLGNGGGREWGANAHGPSLGGYEINWAVGATLQLRAVDTATNNAWNLVASSLYLNTRHVGLTALEDLTVEKTAFQGLGAGLVEIWTRMLGDTEAGGRYAWLNERSDSHTNQYQFQSLQAIAGPKPAALAPAGSFADRAGQRWFYKEDLAQPDSTFRCYFHLRSLDCHRILGSERTMGFAVGGVGLVSGHNNRAAAMSVLANGLWVGPPSAAGDPMFAQAGWWGMNGMSLDIYHTEKRFVMPKTVAEDSSFLVGDQAKPVLADGKYSVTVDWSDWCAVGGHSDPRWPIAITRYEVDPARRTMTVEDNLAVDLNDGLYLGWHFSPSHPPSAIAGGFEFTDGRDLIRVTIEPLGDFGLTQTIKRETATEPPYAQPFKLDGYDLELEWHKTGNGGQLNRIAANVGFIPDRITADNIYKTRVTIQANP